MTDEFERRSVVIASQHAVTEEATLVADRDGGGTTDATSRGVMTSTMILVPLSCEETHSATCRAVMRDTPGWDISIEVDGHTVFTAHRDDWHRTERLCAQIERAWFVRARGGAPHGNSDLTDAAP